jgi:malate dehydrogenase
MAVAAVLGAGPLGGAIAHKLAERAVFREIRLIDESDSVAAGKALDIRQSGPIGRFDVDLTATSDPLAAVGAAVVILADPLNGSEWDGDAGLALIRRLARAGATAPFVLAGPKHAGLMERAVSELKVPADRLVGSAPSALVGAVRALVGLELSLSGTDVAVAVTGRPPAFVVGWSSAAVSGALVTERVPAHRLAAIGQALPRMWPPGPQANASATARIAEALAAGSHRVHHALTVLDGELGVRGVAAMLPLELGEGRVLRRTLPSLSPQERTALMNAVLGSGLVS